MKKMSEKELEEILKSVEWRRPYVNKYYKTFKFKPQWIRDDEVRSNIPDFEDWLKAELRNEKINSLLNEED